MSEIIETLKTAFNLTLNLNINDDIQNIANRGKVLGLIAKAQILISELNNK